MKLNKTLLKGFTFPQDIEVHDNTHYPERVIQFGEGNFLRAFVDWMIDEMNTRGIFCGRVVVVQPISDGMVDTLNGQDGLYTLILRGLKNGAPVQIKRVITSVSRGINPYTDWQDVLSCACNPDINIVISNTTEAGIVYDEADSLDMNPPRSYPGKLTAYLYKRFNHFNGAAEAGMIILPCELIEKNGIMLKEAVLKLAEKWNLGTDFKYWIDKCNIFASTLVDRVVTGYPRDEITDLEKYLGYEDKLIDTGELFHLWVIEGPEKIREVFPLDKAGINVVWTNDQTPYRTRKVRILNGAHTSCVPAAFLYGLDTVKELMDDKLLGDFIRRIVAEEIIPSFKTDSTEKMLNEFADAVMERFENPYIKHYLLSILLNSTSKFKARVLPSLLDYYQKYKTLPEKLVFSLAALICAYRGKINGSVLVGSRDKGAYELRDDMPALKIMQTCWDGFDGSMLSLQNVADKILASEMLWGQDLTQVKGLAPKVGNMMFDIVHNGIGEAIKNVLKKADEV